MSTPIKNALLLLLVFSCFNSFGQIPETDEDGIPNYIKRYDDFVVRRSGDVPVNFAKSYAKADAQLRGNLLAKKSDDEWTPIGPLGKEDLAGMGRINTVVFHPTDSNIWYICVGQGGLWKTTNAGESWVSISGDLPVLRTSSLAIDPSNPDVMYVALGDYAYLGHNLQANENKRNSHYGLGVYKTADGGTTWNPTGLSFEQLDFEGSLIAKILIHRSDHSKILAVGQSGAYLSTNAGNTWQQIDSGLFWDLEQDPVNDNVLFATTGYVHSYKIGHASIVRSNDFGQTWTRLNSGIPDSGVVQRIELAVSPSDNQYVYAVACDTSSGFYGFYRSENGGNSFTQVKDNTFEYNMLSGQFNDQPGGQGRYDLAICVDRYDKNHVLIGGINMWHTTDGGSTFTPLTYWSLRYYDLSMHADIHDIIQYPYNRSYFACHDGGLSRTFKLYTEDTDSLVRRIVKTKWVNYTKGLNITSFYRLSINELNGNEKIAGAQDNSTVFTDGDTFQNLSGGDGMESEFIDAQNYRYTSSQNGRIYVYQVVDGKGKFYSNILPPNKEQGEWTTPMVEANNKLYVLYENLYSYVGRFGGGKHSAFNDPEDNYPRKGTALDMQKTNGKRIYLAKRGYNSAGIKNQIWTSDDQGNNWNDISDGLPRTYYPSYIEMSQIEPDKVWICFSGFDSLNKVYYSENGGEDWTNITYDLPNIPANCIVHQEDGTDLIYIGTDNGIYYLKNGSTNWIYYSSTLPKVIINELEIDTSNRTLVAATFGRGLWEAGLVDFDTNYVGIDQIILSNAEILVSPNPANSHIDVKITGLTEGGNVQLKIIDITGKVVLEEEISSQNRKGEFHKEYDVTTYNYGEYFIVVTDNYKRMVKRFIKL